VEGDEIEMFNLSGWELLEGGMRAGCAQ